MNKTNTKLLLMQRFAQWLNETVQEEEQITPEDVAKEIEDEIGDSKVPVEVYTLQDGTILNVYDDKTIEPQLEDGAYEVEENDEQNIVIKDCLFSGWEDKPVPTAEPIEDLPIAQENEEPQEEQQPTVEELQAVIEGLQATIAEKDATIAELKAQLEGKDATIEQMKSQPSTQRIEAKRIVSDEKESASKLIQALNKKMY